MGKFTRPGGGFNRDRGDRGGRGGFGGGRDRDRGPRQSFKAVCDECGKDCDLPFKPSSDKPVYCSDCFSKHREDRPRRDFGGDRRGGRDHGRGEAPKDWQKQFDILNNKLDRILGRLGTDMPKVLEEKSEKKVEVKEEKKLAKKVEKKAAKKVEKKPVKKAVAKKAPAKKAAPKKAVAKKTPAKKTTKKK